MFMLMIGHGYVDNRCQFVGKPYTSIRLPEVHGLKEAKRCVRAHALNIHPEFHGCLVLAFSRDGTVAYYEEVPRPKWLRPVTPPAPPTPPNTEK